MERTIPYDPALLERNELDRDHFVKIVLPSPHGTLRYTNHYLGTQSLDIDGSVGSTAITAGGSGYTAATVSFTASPTGDTATGTVVLAGDAVDSITLVNEGSGYAVAPTPTISGDGAGATATSSLLKSWLYWDFVVGPIDQGEQDILSVSWISFQSLDNTWQNFASDPGLRRRDILIWRGWYDAGVFDDAILLYEGRIDGHEILTRASLSLVPHNSSFPQQAPWAKPGPLCYYPYKDVDTCQYAGAEPVGETTCPKTRAGCTLRGNTAHFPCDDLAPLEGTIIYR